jgi:N-acetyl-alpha-D-glucosaminyl L-malate synthase BshA
VHTHNFVAHANAAPAARLLKIPVVHTKHGRKVTSFGWAPWFRRYLYELADRVVVVSEETGEVFREKSGVPASRVEVIYNGIDVEKFSRATGTGFREEIGLRPEERVFGAVSRLDPVKDHATMVRAFARVAAKHDRCTLVFVGDGPERAAIERTVEDLGLADRVILAGFRTGIAECLAAFDVFLQPSIREGLSLTILEAAASRVPIISTPVGGTPEIITDGEHGVLVPVGDAGALADAMERFLTDPERFESMAERVFEKISERFSLAGMAEAYSRLYQKLIKS